MIGSNAPQDLSLGQLGSTFINNTTSNSGNWGVIYALLDTAFTALTSGNDAAGNAVMVPGAGIANLNSLALKAGQAIYGHFTTIQLTSGAVVAYKLNVTAGL